MKAIAKLLERSDLANRTVNAALTRAYVRRKFSAPPIIVGGSPRSGTTLLLAILGSHPHILAIDYETNAFYPLFRPLRLLNGLAFTAENRPVRRGREVTRFCEKTPGNIRHLEEINAFFRGDVSFVNIVRDGRDVVTSYDPEDRVSYLVSPAAWVRDIRSALEAEKLPNGMTIKYEDLVNDTQASLRAICAFLNEPFVEGMMDYQRSTNITKSRAWEGRAEQIHRSALGKWRKEKHRERVREFMADPEAVELLKIMGYT